MLDLVTALKALVEVSYSQGSCSEPLIYAAAVLSDYGIGGADADRYARIAAKGLSELDVDRREQFLEHLEVPRMVTNHLVSEMVTPEIREPALPLPEVTEPDLPQLRQYARARIDREAEEQRQRYVTGGSAQTMVYLQKFAEALNFSKGVEGPYPLLQAEVGITGETLADVAAVVLQLGNQWSMKAADIEAKRIAAKAAVKAASTPSAIRGAGNVQW